MNLPEKPETEKRFEEEWKRWLERPQRQAPAEAAAKIAQLARERRPRRRPVWLYAAAAALFIGLVGITTVLKLSDSKVPEPSVKTVQETIPLGEGQVLLWLDSDTPLYMTYRHP
jgi:ferric-dicitrate binding protein FerR (iron transport regulator)